MKSLLLLPALLLLATPAHAVLRVPAPPERGQHVLDAADLITPDATAEIEGIAQRLLSRERTQLFVVAIDSLAEYGAARMSIEDYAALLFKQWGIGVSEAGSLDESRGILVLVSRLDRKARIELGPGWGHSKDSECLSIMENQLVPAFKRGNHSLGLILGAAALDGMASGMAPPPAPITVEQVLLLAGCCVLGFFSLLSLVRHGTSGWAWVFWAAVFGLLWTILRILITPRNSRRSGWGHSSHGSSRSSWSSGSSSSSRGGGGATGSW
ncbi:MAG TPA: TPM domain-containing protein [Myxococcaceae bacterium]|nr:TPM domain-containing protein [Myxococcaceae bacterium]